MLKRDLLLYPTLDEGFKVNFLRRLYLDSLNKLLNPRFETAGTGGADVWANWSEEVADGAIANETTIVHEGTDAAKLTAGPSLNTRVYQDFAVTAGKKHRLRFWTQGDGTYGGRYYLYDLTNSDYIQALVATGVTETAWAILMKEWTAPTGCNAVRFQMRCPGTNTGVCYFDTCDIYLLN